MIPSRTPTFALLLKRLRRATGMTQEQLAARAGYSAAYISMLERGVRQATLATATTLAEALALSPADSALLRAAPGRCPHDPAVPTRAANIAAFPFVGRQTELLKIGHFLAHEGSPLLTLAGVPGIGKTRLLRETAQRAAAQGWMVLEGGCHRHSAREPYAPLLEAISRRLQGRSPAARRDELAGCGWLVRLLPELAADAGASLSSWSLPPEQERRLMFAAVGHYLTNIAGPAGTLLVLDDLQWACQDALDLLATLVRAASDGELPVRMLVAFRPTEVWPADPLPTLLADLGSAGLVARVVLAPLSANDSGVLVETILADDGASAGREQGNVSVCERIVARAEGHPAFLVGYAQSVRGGELAAEAVATAVPATVGEAIRQRALALPTVARETLVALALLGGEAPRAALVSVAMTLGWVESESVRGLDAACHAGLMVPNDDAGDETWYALGHTLFGTVLGAELSAARRAALARHLALAGRGARVGVSVPTHAPGNE